MASVIGFGTVPADGSEWEPHAEVPSKAIAAGHREVFQRDPPVLGSGIGSSGGDYRRSRQNSRAGKDPVKGTAALFRA